MWVHSGHGSSSAFTHLAGYTGLPRRCDRTLFDSQRLGRLRSPISSAHLAPLILFAVVFILDFLVAFMRVAKLVSCYVCLLRTSSRFCATVGLPIWPRTENMGLLLPI
ncbi:hypothetical protein EVAR_91501_1 [Eumeta japonica]|uniref:Uncharacterized protein n=1 Tax=Eumeta variegata TaxID=151549 RepID=A0A4C1VBQ0_EUMVA|nr:hypothetical protein EVAR_91501_1 [Eumeta japonica]